jgi:6-phosphogluconolactonase
VPIDFREFSSSEALAEQLAAQIGNDLRAAVAARGEAVLALSGGSTPARLFSHLSREKLDWSQIIVLPVDERWVPEHHPDSNAGMIRRLLMVEAASHARLLSLWAATESPEAAEDLSRRLGEAFQRIDVAVLGMGADGHTASFFPGASELPVALALDNASVCVAVNPPAADHARMTLTLTTLLAARRRYLHFEGETKLAVYQRALQPGPIAALPVRSILPPSAAAPVVFYSPGSKS